MASSDLRDELNCSICLSLYTDPVSLRCGHNFCRFCIVGSLDAQEASGVYTCPDCRAEYPQRPNLEKNRKLGNIVERFLSTQPDLKETRIFCTYCIKSPVPAVKSCLHCENSLCDDHLMAHNKMSDHILKDPTEFFENKKCSIHKKVLEYYCPQDAACLCVSCCLVGKHRGHLVELLDEASGKKKEELRKYLDELNQQKAELQTRVQKLQDHKINIQEKASDKRKNVSKLFVDIKEQLEIAESKALSEICREEDEIVSRISDLIKKLEIKKDELSRKMHHMEEMCHVTDPIRLLQESDATVSSNEADGKTHSEGYPEDVADDLDEDLISLTLRQSIRDIVTNVTSQLGFEVPNILLDVDTAPSEVGLSDDLKTATVLKVAQNRPKSSGRFLTYLQVLSRCGISSGRHYWEVKWNQVRRCGIGMSYPSIEKKGDQSSIGNNDKSWCLDICDGKTVALYNSVLLPTNVKPTCPTFGVFLDYEAGRLSFYELCDPIRLLHTFTASFTEPLHVAFYVWNGASLTITS